MRLPKPYMEYKDKLSIAAATFEEEAFQSGQIPTTSDVRGCLQEIYAQIVREEDTENPAISKFRSDQRRLGAPDYLELQFNSLVKLVPLRVSDRIRSAVPRPLFCPELPDDFDVNGGTINLNGELIELSLERADDKFFDLVDFLNLIPLDDNVRTRLLAKILPTVEIDGERVSFKWNGGKKLLNLPDDIGAYYRLGQQDVLAALYAVRYSHILSDEERGQLERRLVETQDFDYGKFKGTLKGLKFVTGKGYVVKNGSLVDSSYLERVRAYEGAYHIGLEFKRLIPEAKIYHGNDKPLKVSGEWIGENNGLKVHTSDYNVELPQPLERGSALRDHIVPLMRTLNDPTTDTLQVLFDGRPLLRDNLLTAILGSLDFKVEKSVQGE